MSLNMEQAMSNVPGVTPAGVGEMPAVLGTVEAVIQAELRSQKADGQPLKAAFAAVARAIGVTPRRVRAFHHGEVAEDAVTAREYLAAVDLEARRRRERLAAARRLVQEASAACQ
jgi:hypothetical protein